MRTSLAALLASTCLGTAAQAQNATWNLNPPSVDWNTAANWTPATVPTGTATFGASSTTALTFSNNASIGTMQFNAGAPAYSFTLANSLIQANRTLSVVGAGIVNSSSNAPTFAVQSFGQLQFFNASTAANAAITADAGFVGILNTNTARVNFSDSSTAGSANLVVRFGTVTFAGSSTAQNANIALNGTVVPLPGIIGFVPILTATLRFQDASTAGNARITADTGGVTFANNSSAGTATISNNAASGVIQFNDASTAANATIINNVSAGSLSFTGTSTAGNATITNGGRIFFQANSSGGRARLINNAGGVVDISLVAAGIAIGSIEGAGTYLLGSKVLTVGGNDRSTEVSGTISDGGFNDGTGGSLVKVGAGTLILSGANTYTGGTTISTGTLQLGNGGTSGSIVGSVVDNATFAINRSDTFTFGGTISGSGAFQQVGTGTTVFTANNTYAGGTTITAGTLQLGNGGTSGSIVGNVVDNGILAFNRSDLLAFDGVISGTGAVQQNGTGVTVLTGNSTYTGATAAHAGGLIVNGSIASSSGLTVDPGAFVGGSGALPSLTVGGTLSPGNSIGTITVNGNLTFLGAGNYVVEVSPTAADRTNVTGSAVLAGTLTLLPTGGVYTIGKSYVLLHADGGRTGTFSTGDITALFGPAIRARIAYTGSDVSLFLDPNAITPFLPAGAPRNVRKVAGAIDAMFQSGLAPAPFLSLFNVSAAGLPAALSQLSGEIGTGAAAAAFQTTDQFLGLMLDPFLENRVGGGNGQARGPALAFAAEDEALQAAASSFNRVVAKAPPAPLPAAPEPRWSAWGAGYGGQGTFNGDPVVVGSHDLKASTAGGAGGLDYRFSPNLLVGAAVTGSSLSYSLDGGLGSGKGDVVQAGVYGSARSDRAYLSAAAAFGWYDLSTDRTVLLPGFADRLTADFSAHSVGGRVEAGYRWPVWTSSGVTPYAAVQAQSFRTPTYAERDVGGLAAFALTYNGDTTTDARSELGARFDSRFAVLDNAVLIWRGRAAWAHEFDRERSITAAFQVFPTAPFTVFGALPARDAALLSAGGELRFANGLSLLAKFDGAFGDNTQVYAGNGIVRYTW